MPLDLASIAGFDWDDGNARKSLDKHGVSHIEAEQVFASQPLIVTEDQRHSIGEARYHALGRTAGDKLLHVTFTLRRNDTLVRVISARTMNRKERAIYEGTSREKET
jgi:uncharacterized DUF497 family protein